MKTYKYTFADGYVCWTIGKLSKVDLRNETIAHGKLISMVMD